MGNAHCTEVLLKYICMWDVGRTVRIKKFISFALTRINGQYAECVPIISVKTGSSTEFCPSCLMSSTKNLGF